MGKGFIRDFCKSLDQMEREMNKLCGCFKKQPNILKTDCQGSAFMQHKRCEENKACTCQGIPGFPPPLDFHPPCGRERCCCQQKR